MKIGFFQEAENTNSMTRLITFLLVMTGIIIALATVFLPAFFEGVEFDYGQNFTFCITLIGAGITGKVVQSFGE